MPDNKGNACGERRVFKLLVKDSCRGQAETSSERANVSTRPSLIRVNEGGGGGGGVQTGLEKVTDRKMDRGKEGVKFWGKECGLVGRGETEGYGGGEEIKLGGKGE